MNRTRKSGGFTFIEVLIAGFMMAIVMLVMVQFASRISRSAHQIFAKTRLNNSARNTMDIISRTLRIADPGSVVINTPFGGQPNSSIEFFSVEKSTFNTRYRIYWSSAPVNTVHIERGNTHSIIGRDVSSLMFTGDYRDPSVMNVTLRLDTAYDVSGASRTFSLVFPNQNVRMATSK
jgi:type II secretory pathway pseudopilin PulG